MAVKQVWVERLSPELETHLGLFEECDHGFSTFLRAEES